MRTDSTSFLSERQRIVSFSAFQAGSASPRFVSAHTASRDPLVTLPPLHLASAVEYLPATPNHSSDDELIRGDSATIASPQLPAVNVTGAGWRIYDTSGGVAGRRALRSSVSARSELDRSAQEHYMSGSVYLPATFGGSWYGPLKLPDTPPPSALPLQHGPVLTVLLRPDHVLGRRPSTRLPVGGNTEVHPRERMPPPRLSFSPGFPTRHRAGPKVSRFLEAFGPAG